jgi:hypothetical protein
MPAFVKGGTARTPFGKNAYLRSTVGVKFESYTLSAAVCPAVTIDGFTGQKVIQPGTVMAKITSTAESGKVGPYEALASDGRQTAANIVGICDTFLPWQLMEHDVEIAVAYDAAVVQAWCFERKEVALGVIRERPYPEGHIGLTQIAPFLSVGSDDVIFDYIKDGLSVGLAPARAEDAESELSQKDMLVSGSGRASVIDWALKDEYSASDVTRTGTTCSCVRPSRVPTSSSPATFPSPARTSRPRSCVTTLVVVRCSTTAWSG